MSESGEYRYERKFVVEGATRQEVELLLRLHPGRFSEIFAARWVNNVYLDSPDLANYRASQDGVAERAKIRIRWYGDFATIRSPALEIKMRQGLICRKLVLAQRNAADDLSDLLDRGSAPAEWQAHLTWLMPALLNRYQRRYFRTADGRFRATVDSDLSFSIAGAGEASLDEARFCADPRVVLELKYASEWDSRAGEITGLFPFRLARFSKYVEGVLATRRALHGRVH